MAEFCGCIHTLLTIMSNFQALKILCYENIHHSMIVTSLYIQGLQQWC